MATKPASSMGGQSRGDSGMAGEDGVKGPIPRFKKPLLRKLVDSSELLVDEIAVGLRDFAAHRQVA